MNGIYYTKIKHNYRLNRDNNRINNKQFWIPIFISVTIPILTLIGGFYHLHREVNAKLNLEYKKNAWSTEFELFTNLNQNMNELVYQSVNEKKNFDSVYNKFNELYWGATTIVDDGDIEKLLIKFKTKIDQVKNGIEVPEDDFRTIIYKIAIQFKAHLKKLWE